MALINNSNIKKVIKKNEDLLADFLKLGFKDNRLWTGFKTESLEEVPSKEFSGVLKHAPKNYRLGSIAYNGEYAVIIVGIRFVGNRPWSIKEEVGNDYIIDYVYSNKTISDRIYSCGANNLSVHPM